MTVLGRWRTDPAPVEAVPLEKPPCPFCKSADVLTTSKTVSDSTYWRCLGCGQIWNPSRLLPEWRRRR